MTSFTTKLTHWGVDRWIMHHVLTGGLPSAEYHVISDGVSLKYYLKRKGEPEPVFGKKFDTMLELREYVDSVAEVTRKLKGKAT